jgi:hypothetical protein
MGCGDCGNKLAHGAAGLTKAITGIDAAPAHLIATRRDECRNCPQATRNPHRLNRPSKGLTSLSRCRLCNCFIAAKTKINSEHCPAHKW